MNAPTMTAAATTTTIVVRLTASICQHYRARGVYADLMSARDDSGHVSIDGNGAAGLLADAEGQLLRRDIPRGQPRALRSLVEQLRAALGIAPLGDEQASKRERMLEDRALSMIGRPLRRPDRWDADQLRKARELVEAERLKLAGMPSTDAEFCRHVAALFWSAWSTVYYQCMADNTHESGFKFSSDASRVLNDMAKGLYLRIRNAHQHEIVDAGDDDDEADGLVHNGAKGQVILDPSVRIGALANAMATAARADAMLQDLVERAAGAAAAAARKTA